MKHLEGIAKHLASRGLYVSLRSGSCGQWKVRLYGAEGRKVYEAIAPTAGRAVALALRQVDYATPHDAAA